MTWNPNHPAPSSYVSDLASVVRANKVVIDNSMQTHFYWSDSKVSAGEPRISDSTPGSMRIFYGLESEVSYPGYDGTLMYAHDTGKLWALNSGAAAPIASTNMFAGQHQSQDSTTANSFVQPDGMRNIVAIGNVNVGAGNVKDTGLTVAFGTTFGESPNVMLTSTAPVGDGRSVASFMPCVIDVTTTNFKLGMWETEAAIPATSSVFWRASGMTTTRHMVPFQVGIA